MKVKIYDLLNSAGALTRLSSADLGAKGMYWISKAFRIISLELQEVEKVRQKLLDQYAKKDEEGKLLQIGVEANFKSSEDRQKFLDEYKDLREGEVEINVSEIPWRYLIGKTFRPVPGDFIALDFMLKEPDEKELEEIEKLLGREQNA